MNTVWAYHRAPRKIVGDRLMPLNVLREHHPELYEEHFRKYVGRERICSMKVRPLDCEWSDLLMFTLCDPRVVISEYRASGKSWPEPGNWFQVNPELLDQDKLIIMPYDRDFRVDEDLNEDRFVTYSREAATRYSSFSPKTREYYRADPDPLLFHLMPHLLYRGSVPLTLLEPVSFDPSWYE